MITAVNPADRRRAVRALAAFPILWVAIEWVVRIAGAYVMEPLQIADLRGLVAARAVINMTLLWIVFAASLALLRFAGRTVEETGWRRPASPRGWVLAGVFAGCAAAGILFAMGERAQLLTDWSLYRISLTLALGLTGGICGEVIFRGVLMTLAEDASFRVPAQVGLSSVLFGFALWRIGFGGSDAAPDLLATVGIFTSTAALGALFAGIYLASRRSLMPVIVAHATLDAVAYPGILLWLSSGAP
jgi:hypothetical protein